MKTFRNFLRHIAASLLLLCTATLAACDDTDGNPQFGDSITLEITIDRIESGSVQATVIPSKFNAGYYARLYRLKDIGTMNDKTLLSTCLNAFDFATTLYQGKRQLTFEKLQAQTQYVLVAFGYEDTLSTGVTSDIVRSQIITTPAAPSGE